MSVPTAPAVYEVEELSERLAEDGVDTNDGEWYAIRTDPWPCPACGEVFDYVTACHHVVVAEQRDDLIDHAVRCSQVGRNPKIVRYDDQLPTITLWQWRALGRPVHGIKKS
ncbi:MAG TPA: hypothetical protein VM785_08625 [Gaiellales bacterium]|jgi:hypothetical protein|nr:hypothetical protein [Gaiellales bacterium]